MWVLIAELRLRVQMSHRGSTARARVCLALMSPSHFCDSAAVAVSCVPMLRADAVAVAALSLLLSLFRCAFAVAVAVPCALLLLVVVCHVVVDRMSRARVILL